MLSAEDIQNIIKKNFQTLFHNSFQQLINTIISTPIPVFDNHKKHKYWFVPLLLKSKVMGSAILDTDGKLISHGILTPNIEDENKLINKAYFESVPEKMLIEIKDSYPDYKITSIYFSYDLSPQKWGWLICLKSDKSNNEFNILAGPFGWYEKKGSADFEG